MEIDEQIARLRETGYTILRNAIEPELIDALTDAVVRIEDGLAGPDAVVAPKDGKTYRIHNLLRFGAPFDQLAAHEAFLPIVEGLLDRGCLLSSMTAVSVEPGERAEPIHADDQAIPLPKPHAPLLVNCVVALSPFTVGNAAPRLVPQSHRLPNPEFGVTYETALAEMAAGSVLVYDGALWNGAGPHVSGGRRLSISVNYCAGWVRQEENQILGVPPELVRGWSPRVQELLGWGVYRGLLGHVGRQSPAHRLNAGRKFRPLWER